MSRARAALGLLLAAGLPGCAVTEELHARQMDLPATATVGVPVKARLYTALEDGVHTRPYVHVDREPGGVLRLRAFATREFRLTSIFSGGHDWLEAPLAFDAPGRYTIVSRLWAERPGSAAPGLQDQAVTIEVTAAPP